MIIKKLWLFSQSFFLIKANYVITVIYYKYKNFSQCISVAIVVKNLKPPIGGFFYAKILNTEF